MTENTSRLPENYEVPEVAGTYYKAKNGMNRLRILSTPIIGWMDRETYKDEEGKEKKRSLLYKMDNKPEKVHDPKGLKHFRCTVVWNYDLGALQVRQITQKSIMGAIKDLLDDEDYKDIYGYDIKLKKEGEKLETKYSILPSKPAEIEVAIMDQYLTSGVNLDNMFDWDQPFPKQD